MTNYLTSSEMIKNATAFIIESINDDNSRLDQLHDLDDADIIEFADNDFDPESFKIALIAIDEFISKTQL